MYFASLILKCANQWFLEQFHVKKTLNLNSFHQIVEHVSYRFFFFPWWWKQTIILPYSWMQMFHFYKFFSKSFELWRNTDTWITWACLNIWFREWLKINPFQLILKLLAKQNKQTKWVKGSKSLKLLPFLLPKWNTVYCVEKRGEGKNRQKEMGGKVEQNRKAKRKTKEMHLLSKSKVLLGRGALGQDRPMFWFQILITFM